MKRYLTSCLITLIGIGGFLVMLAGILLSELRAVSLGFSTLGIYGLLYRKSDPDYVPEWYKRHVLLYLSLFAFVLAAVFFVFSLL